MTLGRLLAAAALLAVVAAAHPASDDTSLLLEAQQHYCGDSCASGGATASVGLTLTGSGAHRSLRYSLSVQCPVEEQADEPGEGAGGADVCGVLKAALLQPLPAAVYADIYEIDNAAALEQGPEALLFGQVDVESIEALAPSMLLAVAAGGGGNRSAGSFAFQETSGACETVFEVPLHARYPPPRPSAPAAAARAWWQALMSVTVTDELAPPLVLARCPPREAERVSRWQKAAAQLASDAPVVWERPAGNLTHAILVACGTLAALVLGAVAVLRALFAPAAPAKGKGAAPAKGKGAAAAASPAKGKGAAARRKQE